jgi:hypothetical protein
MANPAVAILILEGVYSLMAKRRTTKKRKRTRSEKIFIILSILIAIGLLLGSFIAGGPSPDTGTPGSSLPLELVLLANSVGASVQTAVVSF